MRRSWAALPLLAGGVLLLASLYLPWQRASCGPGCRGGGFAEVLDVFAGSVDGWSSEVGEAAAAFALLLAALAAATLVRPSLAGRLPLGLCALLAGTFGLAVAAETRSLAHQRAIGAPADFKYAYGAYLGAAAAVAALLGAAAMRRGQIVRDLSASRLALVVSVVGLLGAFSLPWQRYSFPQYNLTFLGIANPAAVVAASLALCLLTIRWRTNGAARTERLVLAAAVALFTVAAFSSLTFPGSHAYGAWIGLGAAGTIVAIALVAGARVPRPALPPWPALATGGAAALVVTSLFLPWQRVCYAKASGFGPFSGHCVSTIGWTTTLGATAGLLAVAVVVAALAPRRLPVSVLALAAGVGVLVATSGFELEEQSGDGFALSHGYGSTIGFAGAGLLLALALARSRPSRPDWKRVAVRLPPIAACVAYLVVVVLPWWDVLPQRLQLALRLAPPSWPAIAGVLLTIGLLILWARQVAGATAGAEWLVLLPLGVLALVALDLIRLRDDGITWGRGIVVAASLLLALLGRVEQREGLENARVPELFRVDRL